MGREGRGESGERRSGEIRFSGRRKRVAGQKRKLTPSKGTWKSSANGAYMRVKEERVRERREGSYHKQPLRAKGSERKLT